jgi:hypothetical protein
MEFQRKDDAYNTMRGPLLLKEYGRNVQKLAEYIARHPDKATRTQMAHTLISLMKQLNPSVRENSDNAQRIWDHLFVMSGFTLDIDGPFPPPNPEDLSRKPLRMRYNNRQIRYKHYGSNIELLIRKALALQNPDERRAATIYIFRLMRTFYATWNKENIEDEVILEQIKLLSNGELEISAEILRSEGQSGRDRQHRQHHHQNQGGQKQRNQGHHNQGRKDKQRRK